MRKEKFIYNTQTLRYEKVVEPLSTTILRIFGFLCAAVVTGFVLMLITHKYFPSPELASVRNENQQLQSELDGFSQNFEQLSTVLQEIQKRDAYAHRMVFGMDPISEGIWEGGVGGHDKYQDLRQYEYSGEKMADLHERVDKLSRQMDIQSHSLDTILRMANEKETMLASLPSIKPVRIDKLARGLNLLSGFGMRIHPIYKVPKMHTGIDFTAPAGTPIQATGEGKVIRADRGNGYGNHVIIDHGYGYQTLYAHMSRIDVKVGQEVKRGQSIGLVGSSGTSTAPHCHYEVIFKGQKIDPINYVTDGLTPAEYEQLRKAAISANQSMD
ncbi:MAG TPA: M23 family metallopeptidase [Flavilitoribacter sp.]|nr:M23 family metallopeptidase [Lewinella sp.]MCB9281584.1 M23 family metallopeptidase [Lewinellaceae bacterium]HMQ61309.1 M23 family metallopeptidase [Flavilitoribacter sp.]HMQ88133.1 M23 family metallopeptidase [Flavilitoribacter sp.]